MSSKRLSPHRYALISAGVYGALATSWILVTGRLAASSSATVSELSNIEETKGIAFVLVTSALFYLFMRAVWTKMAADSARLFSSQQRLMQAEREAITGLIASSIAHDFANVLTVMRLNLARVESQASFGHEGIDHLKKLDAGLSRMAELAARLRTTARHPVHGKPIKFYINDTVKETLSFLRNHRAVQGCQIEVIDDERVELVGQPILVHQLLMNLLLNAAEATEGLGRIRIEIARDARVAGDAEDAGTPGAALISVHDDGPGVPKERRKLIFDAFYTTKTSGSGLGLLSVNSCVAIHRGSVEVQESPLGGALFEVRLPDLDRAAEGDHKFPESLNKIKLEQEPVLRY